MLFTEQVILFVITLCQKKKTNLIRPYLLLLFFRDRDALQGSQVLRYILKASAKPLEIIVISLQNHN